MKYVVGKKSGYKHNQDVEEQINILRLNREEIPLLRERLSSFCDHNKALAESETKGVEEFTQQAQVPGQHPHLTEIYRKFSHSLNITSSNRFQMHAIFEEVKEEWKQLETVDLHELRVKQDQSNRAISDQQYWTSQKKPAKAAEYESKYKVLCAELVEMIHNLRMKKEELLPGYLLRIAQAQVVFAREFLKEAEALETEIRKLGPATPIPFTQMHKFAVQASGGAFGHEQTAPAPTMQHAPTPSPVPVASYTPAPVPSLPRAQGLYPFNAETPQELSFQPGDVLTIISQDGQWWTAELNGKRGLIPSNYVQFV